MIGLIHDIFNIADRYGLKERFEIEEFVVRCLNILKDRGIL